MKTIKNTQFKELLLNDTPFIDVRSEVEFSKGSIPNSVNMPILIDCEREKVGTCYRKEGQEKAIELGKELVSGDIKKERVHKWNTFLKENRNALIYCARGGLRSQMSQKWIFETNNEVPFIDGGFKSLRNFLITEFEKNCKIANFVVLSGTTGSGKTILLNEFKNIIDLEKRANHRGSSFGKHFTNQPAQIDFENIISLDLMRLCNYQDVNVLIEDESRLIGKIHVPDILTKIMYNSDIVVLETPMEQRVDIILKEYVEESLEEYLQINPNDYDSFFNLFLFNLKRISKKLGGLKHKEIQEDMTNAFDAHKDHGDVSKHKVWIEKLLTHYYDPMYNYSLEKRSEQIIFRGSHKGIKKWAQSSGFLI
ncbi:MAG: tRNA 2-selenouridine(34) synthase MnmH [Desulfobacterales bacterium]|nr:tRNA 2-selenouridine(34) synthase MnmH [Desulfobacterales bacterium]